MISLSQSGLSYIINTMHKKRLDFIGIGTQKSATTWIFECLRSHPEICVPERKELKFFLQDAKSYEPYHEKFNHCADTQICGEFSPQYLETPEAAKRIAEYNPNIKLIACLRNPVDRFCSFYYFMRSKEREASDTIDKELANDPHGYVRHGKYASDLEPYLAFFSSDQMLVLIYDDIEKDPVAFIQNIYRFLNVDDTFIPPEVTEKINYTATSIYHIPYIHSLLVKTRKKLLSSKIGRLFMAPFRFFGLGKLIHTFLIFNMKPAGKRTVLKEKPLSKEDKRKLQEYYKEDNKKLGEILSRDLSFWL